MLNGNNAPANANVNYGAVLNGPENYSGGEPFLTEEHILKDGGELRRHRPSGIPVG